jgi:phytoene synthase
MTDDAAYATFEAKWLDAHPEFAVASIFLKADQRRIANAFGVLVHELGEAALRIHEPQVAAAKLGWWRNELAAAAAGQTRHPVTQRLFGDGRAGALGAAPWIALADAAQSLSELPAADRAMLLCRYQPLAAAVARTEALLAFGEAAEDDVSNNAALWTISHLVRDLPHLADNGAPLAVPLDLLARHGLTRAGLGQPSAQRGALLRDHLGSLGAALRERLAVPAARTLYQRVRAENDARLIAAAVTAADPLERLQQGTAAAPWSNLWLSWRVARRLARAPERRVP